MKLLLQIEKSLFPPTKTIYLLTSKNILSTITISLSISINNFNIDTTFKVAWGGFMQLEKLVYTNAIKQSASFKDLHLIRSDITFSKNNQYVILHLRWSKTNIYHTSVLIMLAATASLWCPMWSFYCLFTHNPQSPSIFLFTYKIISFPKIYIIKQLRNRLEAAHIPFIDYSNYSFGTGAV